MFDLLSAALAEADGRRRLHRLPLSFQRCGVGSVRRWRRRPLTPAEQAHARRILTAIGLCPRASACRDRPVTFIDAAHRGATFTEQFECYVPGSMKTASRGR
jgi:hypothetical protein